MAVIEPKITYTATPDQIEAMHGRFDDALAEVAATYGTRYPQLINGEERAGSTHFDVVAPADTSKILARFPKGTAGDIDDAVDAARAFAPAWAGMAWRERVAVMRKAAGTMRERKFRLAALMIEEAGKSRTEAIGEVEEGADLIDYYATLMEQHDGYRVPMGSEDPRERNVSVLRPYGVFAVLAPFNFPNALAAGPIGAALVAGNTVVFKPASATALSSRCDWRVQA